MAERDDAAIEAESIAVLCWALMQMNEHDIACNLSYAHGVDIVRTIAMMQSDSPVRPLLAAWSQWRWYRRAQRRKAHAGAEARWRERAVIQAISGTLAMRRDALGDRVPPSKLWPELYAALEDAELRPVEKKSPQRYTYNGGSISYDAFRRAIQRARR